MRSIREPAVAVLVLLWTIASMAATQTAGASSRTGELWTARYNGPANEYDWGYSMAGSSDGTKVFVTGESQGIGTGYDYATAAYDAATGAELWTARYSGPAASTDSAYSVAVSPDDSTVYVTGTSTSSSGFDAVTIAYDAFSGDDLWTARFDDSAHGDDGGMALAVSPDGTTVYVAGYETGPFGDQDFITLAYDAATGTGRWRSRYNGPGGLDDAASGLALSPDGAKLFVTGTSPRAVTRDDFATVAYDTSTGSQLWAKRLNDPGNWDDIPTAIAVGPNGTTVFVTGQGGTGATGVSDYVTAAYETSTGGTVWIKHYGGPGGGYDYASAVAVTPDSSTVVVTGEAWGATNRYDYATLAYDAATGVVRWIKSYDGPAGQDDAATAVAVSPDGGKVFVTGSSDGGTSTGVDFATLAYDASTGASIWARRYTATQNVGGVKWDGGSALAITPDGATVLVTGSSYLSASIFDYATLAYPA